MPYKATLALAAILILAVAVPTMAEGEDYHLADQVDRLQKSSQDAFVGIQVDQPQNFGKILNKIDELLRKLMRERRDVIYTQKQTLKATGEAKLKARELCDRADVLKTQLDALITDAAQAKETHAKLNEELLMATAVGAKNKDANAKIRITINNEVPLIDELLKMIESLHNIQSESTTKTEDLQKIKEMLTLLTMGTSEQREAIANVDMSLERYHVESITLKKWLIKMREQNVKTLLQINAQDARDQAEIDRLNAAVPPAKKLMEDKARLRKIAAGDYQIALKGCEEKRGEYHELAKSLPKLHMDTYKKLRAINREIIILRHMRRRVIHHMGKDDFATRVAQAKAKEAAAIAAHKAAWEAAKAAGKSQAVFMKEELERRANELAKLKLLRLRRRQARLAARRRAALQARREELAALAAVKRAQQNAAKAKELLDQRKQEVQNEHTRNATIAAADAAQNATLTARTAKLAGKIAKCISLLEVETLRILKFKAAPKAMVKACARLTGNDQQIRAGLITLIKGSKLYRKRVCRGKINKLFKSVMGRGPEYQSLRYYTKQCVYGLTMEEIESRLRNTEEYKAKVDNKFRAQWCLKKVRGLFEEILERKSDTNGLLFFTQKCIKGKSINGLKSMMRRLPEYRAVLQRNFAMKKLNREAYIARQRARAAARYKAKMLLWKKEHMRKADKGRKSRHVAAKKRLAAHIKALAEAKRRQQLWKDWFAQWKTSTTAERTQTWQKLVKNSQVICSRRYKLCRLNRAWRKSYRALRTTEAASLRKYRKAVRKLNKMQSGSAGYASQKALCSRLEAHARRLGARAVRVSNNKVHASSGCQTTRRACSLVVHRFHLILGFRMKWMRKRLAVWQARMDAAAKQIDTAESDMDKSMFQNQYKMAQRGVERIQDGIARLQSTRDSWKQNIHSRRAAAWKRKIKGWKRNNHCYLVQFKASTRFHVFYKKAMGIARRSVKGRRRCINARRACKSKGCRGVWTRRANNALARYHSALKVAAKFFRKKARCAAKAWHCQHRAAFLINKVRHAALRRAHLLYARRLRNLVRAKRKLRDAKRIGDQAKINTAKSLLDRCRKEKLRARRNLREAKRVVRMAARAEARLKRQEAKAQAAARQAAALNLRRAHGQWSMLAKEQAADRRARIAAQKQRIKDAARRRRFLRHKARKMREWGIRRRLIRKKGPKYCVASAIGDPHITTMHNANINLNANGDFVLFRSSHGEFECQARTSPNGKGASHISAVACSLPGTKGNAGDLIEITSSETALNRNPHTFASGATTLNGGTFFRGADSAGVRYLKVAMKNGIFLECNTNSNGAINVIAAIPSTLENDLTGVFLSTAIPNEAQLSDIQEDFRPVETLFTTRISEGQTAYDSDPENRVIDLEMMRSSEELCKASITGQQQAWAKCKAKCVKSPVLKNKCVVDAEALNGLPAAEVRACECLFDVAYGGTSYAKSDAAGFELESNVIKQTGASPRK